MKRLPGKSSVYLLLTLLTCSATIWAQSDRASIVGRVSDPTGAVVSGATVKVTNEATGVGFDTSTDDGGRFVTPNILKTGTYKVEVSRDGFKTKVTSGIVLNIGDVQEVNVTLEVGAAGETITVTSEAPQLETETSNRGEVITGRQVTELPLKDRNFTQLATLTPGVSRARFGILSDQTALNQGDPNAGSAEGLGNAQGSSEASRFSRSGGAAISANGLRPTNNNFSLDGVDNNEPQFGTIGVFPNPDAIAEFKVETSVAKAETGRGGANINTTFQSGTNSFHGSVYYYGQNDALNATHAEIRRKRGDLIAGGLTPEEAEARQPKTRTRIHEFGFTFGGPLIKNRTFFFGDYLGQRNSIPIAFSTNVPSPRALIGDFSEFPNPVLDPQTCNTPGNVTSGGCTAFTGNIVSNDYPGGLQTHPDFSPIAAAFLALFPPPTIDVLNPDRFVRPNFFGTRANAETIDSFDIKIDHRLTDNNNLSGRYSRSNQERVRANQIPGLPTAGFGAGEEGGNTRQIVVSDTHAFRPTILNEAKFGWTQIDINIFNCGVGGACGVSETFAQDLGIDNCNKGTLPTTGGCGIGSFGTGEFEFTGDGGLFRPFSDNFYAADSLTIISGKHTWKFGAEARIRHLDTIDGGRSGFLKGTLEYTPSFAGSTGNATADMLLSQPAGQARVATIIGGANPFQLRTTEWSFYVQDDWKVTPNLTLNLGVRYEIFPGYSEVDGRLANYDVAAREVTVASGSGDRLIETDHNNFGPRVGFAYTFGDERQYVLRGGYGLFYTQDGVDYPPLVRNPPITSAQNRGTFNGDPTVFNFETGPPPDVTDPTLINQFISMFVLQTEQKIAPIHQWNLTLQWQFTRDWLMDLGYVASRSRNLLATRQLGNNGNGLGLARTPTTVCVGCTPDVPFNSVVAYENRASANYDALQAKVEKQFSRGVLGRISYTWSHNIDDSSGVFQGAGEFRGDAGGPLNPFDFSFDRANSALDYRHLFASIWIVDLPFGRGKHFGGDMSSGWDKVIGGWQANFIFTAQTGQHFSVRSPCNGCGNGDSNAVLIGDPFSGLAPGQYLNPAAFARPSTNPADPGFSGTTCVTNLAGKLVCFGDSGRNRFVGPGFFRTDFSLFKNTAITERVRFQFGIEFFNMFNHNNPLVPQSRFTDGDFGQFRNALPPRQIQYRLKVIF